MDIKELVQTTFSYGNVPGQWLTMQRHLHLARVNGDETDDPGHLCTYLSLAPSLQNMFHAKQSLA